MNDTSRKALSRATVILLICVLLIFAAILASRVRRITASGRSQRADPEIRLTNLRDEKIWAKVTKEPYQITNVMDLLDCARPNQDMLNDARERNPHESAYIDVFVNANAQQAFLSKGTQSFPPGAMIVKEKKYIDALNWNKQSPPSLYTVMIKRKTGYNPSGGDWEYAVVDGDGTSVLSRGRIDSCMNCHEEQSANGFVFATYLTK